VGQWSNLAPGRPVVVYCAHGHEVSQGVAAALAHNCPPARKEPRRG